MLAHIFSTVFILFIIYYHVVVSQNSCASRDNCQDCIRDPGLCVWCAMDDFTSPERCKPKNASLDSTWCPYQLEDAKTVVNPSGNKNFNDDPEHMIQIKPQMYKIKLRPGKPETFSFSFRAAENYPVDMYFLLDASTTMSNILNQTWEQSQKIYENIKKITNNVTLGLGTFVDKKLRPFYDRNTDVTYSFRHHFNLTEDYMKFRKAIENVPKGSNRDEQEGGLDALAQVMACKHLIGWRKESRKIIILMTDGPYHAAYDGRSAGVFKPYDGKCYSESGTYAKESEMDYPSVGMINKMAVEGQFIVYFLVSGDAVKFYGDSGLSSAISGSRWSTYSEDISLVTKNAISEKLRKIYEEISKTITLKVRSGNPKINVTFNPNCIPKNKIKACDIEIGKEKTFSGVIELSEYNGQDKFIVEILVESLKEKLILDVEVIGCDCAKNPKTSALCHGEMNICGKCDCGPMRYGANCKCQRNLSSGNNDNSTCIAEGSGVVCSGELSGKCVCGACECNKGYEGKFCQCDKNKCRGPNGLECSGHGTCGCETIKGEVHTKCKCNNDWEDKYCTCPKNACKVIGGKMCNNIGICNCGICQCDASYPAVWDARSLNQQTCELVSDPGSQIHQCNKLGECVKCKIKGNDCSTICNDGISTTVVKTLTEEYKNNATWNMCTNLRVDVACFTEFVYRYNDKDLTIEVVGPQDIDCAKKYYAFGAYFLLALIIVGIATLLIWKCLTNIRDRREFEEFEAKSKANDRTSVNPLYMPAQSVYCNPGFRKRSHKEK